MKQDTAEQTVCLALRSPSIFLCEELIDSTNTTKEQRRKFQTNLSTIGLIVSLHAPREYRLFTVARGLVLDDFSVPAFF